MNLLCGKILNVLGNCVIGIAIGLVVALIISLVLHFTCFREKNMMILYVVMLVLFSACGGIVQYKYFNTNVDISITPQEQVDTVIDTIGNNWTNTNGGFTFDQIMNLKDDDTAPTCDDQIIDMDCYDFGAYVVFSYKNGHVYENAMFYKSTNGLILDGMINMSAKMDSKYKFPWWRYNHDTFRWIDGRNETPKYNNKKNFLSEGNDNLVSLSSQSASFLFYSPFISKRDEACVYAMKQASTLTGKNVADRFIKFGDVELIGIANTGHAKINTFYNYLYEQIKGQSYGKTKLVGCNSMLCVVVPDNLRQNYPIPADKMSEYGDSEYYGVYKCDIGVNLKLLQGNKTYTSTMKNEEFFEELENDDRYKDKVQVEKVEEVATYSKLNLLFRDTGNSDMSSLNLLSSPIKIVLQNATTGAIKSVVVDSLDKLNTGVSVLLESGANINYQIYSNDVVFAEYKGSFVVSGQSNSLMFDFYYLNNKVVASIGLNPVGSINMSLIDLSKTPVKIILSNATQSYTFVFDDNSKIDELQTRTMELGEYNYSILSDKLVFASDSGTLNLTSTDRVLRFNYAVKVESETPGGDEPEIELRTLGLSCNTYLFGHNITLMSDDNSYNYFYRTFDGLLYTDVEIYDDSRLIYTENLFQSVPRSLTVSHNFDGLSAGTYKVRFKFYSYDYSLTCFSEFCDVTFGSADYSYNFELTLL